MLDISKVRAITLDLDDTLWPIWPTIERAEAALAAWLTQRAPVAAGVFANPKTRVAMREEIVKSRPDLSHDMSALRRESWRCIAVEKIRNWQKTRSRSFLPNACA